MLCPILSLLLPWLHPFRTYILLCPLASLAYLLTQVSYSSSASMPSASSRTSIHGTSHQGHIPLTDDEIRTQFQEIRQSQTRLEERLSLIATHIDNIMSRVGLQAPAVSEVSPPEPNLQEYSTGSYDSSPADAFGQHADAISISTLEYDTHEVSGEQSIMITSSPPSSSNSSIGSSVVVTPSNISNNSFTRSTTIFATPSVEMTTSTAIPGSDYVVPARRRGLTFANIKPRAYPRIVDSIVQHSFEVVCNKTYTLSTNQNRHLTYAGFKFPDSTQLTYLPVEDIEIKYDEILGIPENVPYRRRYGFEFVNVKMRAILYDKIYDEFERAFKSDNESGSVVTHPGYYLSNFNQEKITINCDICPASRGCCVIRVDGVLLKMEEALETGKNLTGKALLGVKFSRRGSGVNYMRLSIWKFEGTYVSS